MVLSDETISNLYRIRKTAMQMLKDRGYDVVDAEINVSIDDFKNTFGGLMKREDLEINKAKRNNPADQIYVFFPEEPKVGITAVKKYVTRLQQVNASRAILVLQDKLTGLAENFINSELASTSHFHIEVFQRDKHSALLSEGELDQIFVLNTTYTEAELLWNITEHDLVPEHQVLTEEEKKNLLERYTVRETQLPAIQVNDPVVRYYGLERGQVVKVIRTSETAGKYATYRLVV